jgi:hypothetical protein
VNLLVLDDYVPAGLIEKLKTAPGKRERQETWFTDRDRVDLDRGPVLDELFAMLTSDDLIERVEGFDDLAFRLYWSGAVRSWQAFVSTYDFAGMGYRWHVDQGIDARALNFIINLNEPSGRYVGAGGYLELSTQPFSLNRDGEEGRMRATVKLAPRLGRLLIFPACYPHRVTRATFGRMTCHGHFCV